MCIAIEMDLERERNGKKNNNRWILPHSSLEGPWFEGKTLIQPQKDRIMISYEIQGFLLIRPTSFSFQG